MSMDCAAPQNRGITIQVANDVSWPGDQLTAAPVVLTPRRFECKSGAGR